jgi:anti-sigma regulatory factor (Ser/Thr protein kinase)
MHSAGQARSVVNSRLGVTPVDPGADAASETATAPDGQEVRRTFPGDPSQVPLVRDFVRRYLAGQHDCPVAALDDILSCVTELAANAVVHSRSGLPGGHFGARVEIRAGEWVWVAVDDDGGPWEEHHADDHAEHGHGLQIVYALSAGMGITGDGLRRTVWFRCQWNPGSPECGNQVAHPSSLRPITS